MDPFFGRPPKLILGSVRCVESLVKKDVEPDEHELTPSRLEERGQQQEGIIEDGGPMDMVLD